MFPKTTATNTDGMGKADHDHAGLGWLPLNYMLAFARLIVYPLSLLGSSCVSLCVSHFPRHTHATAEADVVSYLY